MKNPKVLRGATSGTTYTLSSTKLDEASTQVAQVSTDLTQLQQTVAYMPRYQVYRSLFKATWATGGAQVTSGANTRKSYKYVLDPFSPSPGITGVMAPILRAEVRPTRVPSYISGGTTQYASMHASIHFPRTVPIPTGVGVVEYGAGYNSAAEIYITIDYVGFQSHVYQDFAFEVELVVLDDNGVSVPKSIFEANYNIVAGGNAQAGY